ncbi:MAG: LptE family protein [Flavobacteriales bacterium]|nr:LptE family protein [Flavobacteriales bacterium]
MRKFYSKIAVVFSVVFLSSCGFYSFTGASISPDVKTVSVEYFPNRAATIQPTLSQVFTERLKDYFLEQTNLSLETDNGDLNFSGEIVKYEVKPIAIQANEQAAQNRLTIAIKVKFENTKEVSKNFEQKFSRYADYDSSKSLAEVEDNLIEQITNELAEDIFNKAVVNW